MLFGAARETSRGVRQDDRVTRGAALSAERSLVSGAGREWNLTQLAFRPGLGSRTFSGFWNSPCPAPTPVSQRPAERAVEHGRALRVASGPLPSSTSSRPRR